MAIVLRRRWREGRSDHDGDRPPAHGVSQARTGAGTGSWYGRVIGRADGRRGAATTAALGRGRLAVLVAGMHLAVLSSLAFAQPLFDLLRRNAEFFAVRDSRPIDIVVSALALVLVPPIVLGLVEALVATRSTLARRWLHLGLVGVLVAVIALPLLSGLSGSSALVIPLAIAVGGVAATLYARVEAAHLLLTVLSPAPAIFIVAFLLFSPVTELVTGREARPRLGPGGSRTPVVMLVLDELPLASLLTADGKIDARRFPGFAALARTSSWFPNTSATDAFTQAAVPAILTGVRPVAGALPTFSDHPDSVFTLLGANHRLDVEESITQVCPRELCPRPDTGFGARINSLVSDLGVVSGHLLLPDDLRRRLPPIDSSWRNFRGGPNLGPGGNGGEITASALEKLVRRRSPDQDRGAIAASFIAGLGSRHADPRPAFHFLHLELPHVPWQYLPDGSAYAAASAVVGLSGGRWSPVPGSPDVGYQRHLLQLAYADRLLGRILSRLKAAGIYDRSLVVVTADHGAAFSPGELRRKLTPRNAPDILSVPLFVKAPRQRRGRVVLTHLQTLDVLPTMAALLGQRIPWRVDGRSAFAPGADRRTVTAGNGGKGQRTFDTRRVERGRTRAVRDKLALFGAAATRSPLDGFVLEPALVGRPVDTLARVGAGGARATVDGAAAFDNVHRAATLLPVHVTGRVTGDGVSRVAIAVGGRIAAVARVFPVGEARAFEAVIPPSMLRDGSNPVEVLALGRTRARTTVASLGRAGGRSAAEAQPQARLSPASVAAGRLAGGTRSSRASRRRRGPGSRRPGGA